MKFAECECKDCDLEFKIVFSNSYPKIIKCPKCGSTLIKVNWIDRAGFNTSIEEGNGTK